MNKKGAKHVTPEEVLAEEGLFISMTKGTSMRPLLKAGRDSVAVVPLKGELKRYDVPLYKRGELYVLHRVIGVKENEYLIRGDNCCYDEHVPKDRVIGVAVGFYRGNRYVDCRNSGYRLYSRLHVFFYPVRWAAHRVHCLLAKIKHKILGR